MPDTSVIIVSYRTPELLRRCLELLTDERARRLLEIIVVDNDSGDQSPEVARSFPGVQLLETGRNLGFAGGVNRGLELAKGRYLLVLNPDVEITSGAIDILVDHLEEHPEAGMAAPKLLNTDGSLQFSCRRDYTFLTVLLRRTFLGRLFPNASALRHHLMHDYDHKSPRTVDWVSGAAMMVRAEAIEDVGPMDERYFLYFEDVDWCTRMRARGWKVAYVPRAVMTHHWQRESRGLTGAARRHIHSGLRFLDRWSLLLYVTRRYRKVWTAALLILFDVLIVSASFLVAYFVRQRLAFLLERPLWPLSFYASFFTTGTLLFLAIHATQGLYREMRGDAVDLFFRVLKAATVAALALMAMTFLLRMRGYSRVIVLGAWPLIVVGSFLTRRFFRDLLTRVRRDRWTLRRIALLGPSPLLDRIERALRAHPQWGWEPIRVRNLPPPGPDGERALLDRLGEERVSEVVVTPGLGGQRAGEQAASLLALRQSGLGLRLLADFLTGLPLRARMESVGDFRWLTLEDPGLIRRRPGKWWLDKGLSLGLGLLGGGPFLVYLLGAGIARRQVWEPRTLFRGRWGGTFRCRRLARGGWLRDYPLLGNVLRGQMSFVGPRPLRPEEPVPGGDAWLRVREQVRPGLAGPWRLVPPSDLQEEMRQELRYLEESTVEQDLKLLVRIILQNPGKGEGSASSPTGENRTTEPRPDASRSEPFVDLRS